VHGRGFVDAIFAAFGDAARVYLTRDRDGKAVGGAVALRFRGVVTVPWASSLREHFPACPNHSLYWRILADAAGSGATAFDFGRSHEGSGTYHFKRQWGAEPRPLLWKSFDPEGRPLPPSVLKPDEHRILTRIWRSLPVRVASKLGPVLRRQLSN
jgi:hypothetical protein